MTIYFPFSVTIRKEENTYISICPEADIVCRGGESIEEAVTNLKKEVEQFLGGKNCPGGDFRKLYITKKFFY